jgi:hypothetical protein
MKRERGDAVIATVAIVVLLIVGLILGLMFGLPVYSVWQQGLSGQAALARAEQTRQIILTQAKAEEAAAEHRAKAIAIMGEMAKKYPEYRQQEFIGAFAQALHDGHINQIIYVPTEAGIPILEAGKR